MKNLLYTIAFTFGIMSIATAQSYQHAIGLRGGNPAGITYKQTLGGATYFEGILATQWRGFSLTGLYEIQRTPWAQPGLAWYYGIGGHIGQFNGKNAYWGDKDGDIVIIGVDAIIGLEYTLQQAPFNFSLDYKPAFNLIGYTGGWFDGVALSIRYTF